MQHSALYCLLLWDHKSFVSPIQLTTTTKKSSNQYSQEIKEIFHGGKQICLVKKRKSKQTISDKWIKLKDPLPYTFQTLTQK